MLVYVITAIGALWGILTLIGIREDDKYIKELVSCTKKYDRVPGDTYATWTAICVDETQRHPYVVWTIVARPEGFSAYNGTYCTTLMDAVHHYNKRK